MGARCPARSWAALSLRGVEILGALVALYAAYAAWKGEVYAKSGVWRKVVSREESPSYFWIVIAIYACLGVALMTIL